MNWRYHQIFSDIKKLIVDISNSFLDRNVLNVKSEYMLKRHAIHNAAVILTRNLLNELYGWTS